MLRELSGLLAASLVLVPPADAQNSADTLPQLPVQDYVPPSVRGFEPAEMSGLTSVDSTVQVGVQEGVLVSYSRQTTPEEFNRGIHGYGMTLDVLRFDTPEHVRASVSEDFAKMGTVDTTQAAGLPVVVTRQELCRQGQGTVTYWLGYRQGGLAIRIAVDQSGECAAFDWDRMRGDAEELLGEIVREARSSGG